MPSYFPARDLRMVVEDIDALSDALRSNAKQMVLFKAKESGDDSYRVFDPEDWPDDDELAEKLRRELGEWSALPIVRVRGRAAGVVVRNGAVIGVQIGDMSHVRGRRGPAGRDLSTYFDLAFDAPSGSIAGGRPRDDGRESGPGPTRGPSDDRSPVVRRTPHMDPHPVDPPTPVGSTFTVDVYADDEVMAEDEGGADIAVELPPDVDSIMLTVRLAVTAHFRVRGRDQREIRISREEIKSRRVRFNLQVEDVPGVGTAGIQALFSYHGRPCGFVGRTWDWDPAMPVAAPAPADGNAAASLPVHVDTARPDLSVIITAPVNDGIHYQCAVETERVPRHRHRAMNDWALPQQASTLVQQQLSAVFAGGQSAKQRQRALLEAGYEFWNAAPPPMRDALWAMIDAHRPPRSIYIASAEPSLPWELMIPFRQKRSNSELRPLGVEFAIGRWCRGDAVSPPQRIPVRNSFVIAPRYEAERKLDAGEEIRLVRTELSGRRVMASSIDGLDQYFNKNSASLLHFVCHGSSIDGDDVLDLSETETLRSATLRTLGGFKKMCRRRAPFVFLNACSTATINPGLAGGAGFPLAFGDLGARAVLAPLWPVDDSVAGDFAVALYRAALVPGAPPVAEIIRRFRQKAYQKITQDGESAEWTADTWAAYAFFGDPLARLERVGR